MTELTKQQRAMVEFRQYATDREEAHRLVHENVVGRLESVREALTEMNFGEARDQITALLEAMPHGDVVTIFPLFDACLEVVEHRREQREQTYGTRAQRTSLSAR